jgi:hypothetical protein
MTGLAGEPVAYFLRKVIILIFCGLFNVVKLNLQQLFQFGITLSAIRKRRLYSYAY